MPPMTIMVASNTPSSCRGLTESKNQPKGIVVESEETTRAGRQISITLP